MIANPAIIGLSKNYPDLCSVSRSIILESVGPGLISSAQLCSAPQHRAVPCGTLRCRALRCSTVQCCGVTRALLYVLFRTCRYHSKYHIIPGNGLLLTTNNMPLGLLVLLQDIAELHKKMNPQLCSAQLWLRSLQHRAMLCFCPCDTALCRAALSMRAFEHTTVRTRYHAKIPGAGFICETTRLLDFSV